MTFSIDVSGWSPRLADGIELLFAVSVRAVVVVLVAMTLGWILRRAAARVRYLLWVGALLGVVAVPLLMHVAPRWTAPVFPDLQVRQVRPDGLDAARAERARRSFARPSVERPDAGVLADSSSAGRSAWPIIIAGVWIAGASIPLAWLTFGLVTVARITRAATPLGGADWNGLIAELRLHGHLPGRVRLRRSDRILTPMTWGLLRPVVLMPADGDAWPPERRRVVLLHELVHIRRFDWPAQVLAQLLSPHYA